MGHYVNPRDMEKEAWLELYAEKIAAPTVETAEDVMSYALAWRRLPVCWVMNTYFTAAGIAYDADEVRRFVVGRGERPWRWYTAPIALLKLVAPDLERELEAAP